MATPHQNKAIIRGSGAFPLDMLRYDQCFPASEEDSRKIAQSIEDFYKRDWMIRVRKNSSHEFTVGRWESFGCTVETVSDF